MFTSILTVTVKRTGRLHTLSCHPHSMFCFSAQPVPRLVHSSHYATPHECCQDLCPVRITFDVFQTPLICCDGTTVCSLAASHFLLLCFQPYVQMFNSIILKYHGSPRQDDASIPVSFIHGPDFMEISTTPRQSSLFSDLFRS